MSQCCGTCKHFNSGSAVGSRCHWTGPAPYALQGCLFGLVSERDGASCATYKEKLFEYHGPGVYRMRSGELANVVGPMNDEWLLGWMHDSPKSAPSSWLRSGFYGFRGPLEHDLIAKISELEVT